MTAEISSLPFCKTTTFGTNFQRPESTTDMGRSKQRADGPTASIIYDPFREVLSKEVIAEDERINYEQVPIHGRSKRVNIYLDIGMGEATTKMFLARVDLGQLGWSEKMHRRLAFEHTQEIWVKGKVPSSQIRERSSWPPDASKSDTGLETPEQRKRPFSTGA